jgi:ribosomal protein S18 acetylase RimI-like enzyme
MTTTTIALLSPEHGEAYRALRLDALTLHPDAFISSAQEESQKPLEWYRQRIAARVDAPHDFFLGAWQNGILRGTVGLQGKYRNKEHHVASVVGMYVAPEGRGAGLGRTLMNALLARARTFNALDIIQLTVTQGNGSAQRLYAQCGFTVWGVEADALRLDGKSYGKVHMAMRLRAGTGAP